MACTKTLFSLLLLLSAVAVSLGNQCWARTSRKDCVWGPWSKWSSCDTRCGCSMVHRTRSVLRPPTCGGKLCIGPCRQAKKCCDHSCCKKDCLWAPWAAWSSCCPINKVTMCGAGTRVRTRNIAKPQTCGGSPCFGNCEEKQKCDICCPKNCEWGAWTPWSACSSSCGSGTQSRTRCISKPASCGGECDGKAEEIRKCTSCCPRNCRWSNWSRWSNCKFPNGKTCGTGQTSRSRTVTQQPSCGGAPCQGSNTESKTCSKCCPVDCRFSKWTPWTPCKFFGNNKCGVGWTFRTRKVEQYPSCGGKGCKGKIKESKRCDKCCPVNCRWGGWSRWSSCKFPGNNKCGKGSMTRTRSVAQKPSCGGAACSGSSTETKTCAKCCPVDCRFSKWTPWSTCKFVGNRQCGVGYTFRTRKVEQRPSCGGKGCKGALKESKRCDKCCPVNCRWGGWSRWSSCKFPGNNKCGKGSMTRSRSVAQKPSCGGAACSGSSTETKTCQKCCPVNCRWGDWTPWSPCKTPGNRCGKGTTERTREVEVRPSCGGRGCSGGNKEKKRCNVCCPTDCTWGAWTAWSKCSSENGMGFHTRSRRIVKPATCGGKCPDHCVEKKSCNGHCHFHCDCAGRPPVHCQWGSWGPWSECSSPCEGGFRSRAREVKVPARCGGNQCAGNSEQIMKCTDRASPYCLDQQTIEQQTQTKSKKKGGWAFWKGKRENDVMENDVIKDIDDIK